MRSLTLLLGFMCVLNLAACQQDTPPPEKTSPTTPVVIKKDVVKSAADKQIDKLRNDVVFYTRRGKTQPKSAGNPISVANAHLSLAALTGDVTHYVSAQEAITQASTLAGSGSFLPLMTRARFAFAVHQVDAADKDLKQFLTKNLLNDVEKNTVLGIRSDIKYHKGQLEEALGGYRASIGQRATSQNISRLGWYYLTTGQPDLARKAYDDVIPIARQFNEPQQYAWALLMRGIVDLETGKLDEALRFFKQADGVFSGWYLIQEHIAEVYASTGKFNEAEALYLKVLERAPNGEFMDALADVYDSMERPDDAAAWRVKAKAAYERDLKALPSSAYGHALDHYLTQDKARALELAQANHDLRPGMEAKLKLAQAHMLHAQTDKAEALLDAIMQSPYRTSEFLATASKFYAKRGDQTLATQYAQDAKALNPGAMDDVSWLP